jgi:putative resolvase
MEKTMGTGEAARLLGITVKTLQRWEREGRLVPAARTASNRRRYTESQLRTFLRLAPAEPGRVVAYCRVSSAARRPDLANQRRVLEQFAVARGLAGVEYYAALHGCELLVLNQERLSPEQEMVQDLMTITHCFSSRLYGLRNYRRQLRAALENEMDASHLGHSSEVRHKSDG